MKIISRAQAIEEGLTRYFTGVACPAGHITERYTASRNCFLCAKEKSGSPERLEYLRQYKAANPEKVREWAKVQRERDPNKYREMHRRKRERHGEKYTAYRGAYIEATRTKIRATDAEYRKNNAEKVKAAKAAWAKANPEAGRAYAAKRRSQAAHVGGSWTKADINGLLRAQRCRCAACRESIKTGYEIDHIQPLSKGGHNNPSNLQLLCLPCNRRKHARDPIEFMQSLGRLL